MEELSRSLLKTLHYADLFDYPLKIGEIHRFLISNQTAEPAAVTRELEELLSSKQINRAREFYFLPGREVLVETRSRREAFSRKRIDRIRGIIFILSLLPWVRMIGLTGNLAMENSEESDDVDLMMVTATNRLWLTRFVVFLFLRLVGLKRNGGRSPARNKICINLWCDEKTLRVPKEDQDLVVAHEIVQMKVLFDRATTHECFISENLWLKGFLPNWKT